MVRARLPADTVILMTHDAVSKFITWPMRVKTAGDLTRHPTSIFRGWWASGNSRSGREMSVPSSTRGVFSGDQSPRSKARTTLRPVPSTAESCRGQPLNITFLCHAKRSRSGR